VAAFYDFAARVARAVQRPLAGVALFLARLARRGDAGGRSARHGGPFRPSRATNRKTARRAGRISPHEEMRRVEEE